MHMKRDEKLEPGTVTSLSRKELMNRLREHED